MFLVLVSSEHWIINKTFQVNSSCLIKNRNNYKIFRLFKSKKEKRGLHVDRSEIMLLNFPLTIMKFLINIKISLLVN